MYIYIYIYVYIYMNIYIYMCVYIYIYTCVCIYIYMYVYSEVHGFIFWRKKTCVGTGFNGTVCYSSYRLLVLTFIVEDNPGQSTHSTLRTQIVRTSI